MSALEEQIEHARTGGGALDGLLRAYAGPSTLLVTLPLGEVFEFRNVQDYGEISRISRAAVEWARNVLPGLALTREEYASFRGMDVESAAMAYSIHAYLVSPDLTLTDMLTLFTRIGQVMAGVARSLDGLLLSGAEARAGLELESKKNDCETTSSGVYDYESHETCGGDTPTS